MGIRMILLGVVLVLVGAVLRAQGPRKDVGLDLPAANAPDALKDSAPSIDPDLVNVSVVVTDTKGFPVRGLDQRDFKIFDEDVERPVASFRSADAPVSVVIMFEFTETVAHFYDDIFKPVIKFANSLPADDWSALVRFDLRTEIVSDLTRDRSQLSHGLTSLRLTTPYDIVLFDAVDDVLGQLKKIDGKKAILLISSGYDTMSKRNAGEVLKKVETSDAVIYGVSTVRLYLMSAVGATRSFRETDLFDADTLLLSLSEGSGGQSFYPSSVAEYPVIYGKIGEQLRGQYSIGFLPANLKKDGRFHKLRIEVPNFDANKDGMKDVLRVRHQRGYY